LNDLMDAQVDVGSEAILNRCGEVEVTHLGEDHGLPGAVASPSLELHHQPHCDVALRPLPGC
jgi:hypothetical protein